MSVTATEDLIVGSRIRANKTGYWAERSILIEGLDPNRQPGLIFGAVLPSDQNDGTTISIPNWASLHPTIIGCYAIEVSQEPFPHNSKTSLLVKAQYGPGEMVGEWKITVTGSNGTKQLSVEKDGTPITIEYTPPGSSDPQFYFVDTPYLAPGSVVTFEHEEYTSPWSKLAAFKSTTNSVPFLGYPAHCVLFRDIEIESFANLTRWRVRYIVEIDPSQNGWRQIEFYHDQYTGEVPTDVHGTDGNNGIYEFDPYELAVGTADFNTLGLPTAQLLGAAGAVHAGPSIDGQFTPNAYSSGAPSYGYLGGGY